MRGAEGACGEGCVLAEGRRAADEARHLAGLPWEELNRRAKRLEGAIDARLIALGRLTSSVLRRGGAGHEGRVEGALAEAEGAASAVEAAISHLGLVLEALSAPDGACNDGRHLLPARAGPPGHLVGRHGEIVGEYARELAIAKEHLRGARTQARLVASVQEEIYGCGGDFGRPPSRMGAEHVLEVAYEASYAVREQRGRLHEVRARLRQASDRFPLVGALLGKIRGRRRRDVLVVAAVMGALLVLLFLALRAAAR